MEQSKHARLFDPENAAEMGRLLLQDRLVNEAMGGYFPERDDLYWVLRVLDIGCGPGGWALGVAKHYPHMKVFGIDANDLVVAYAKSQAVRMGVRNAFFDTMDALGRLDFPDSHFDVVNMRAAGAWIPRSLWPGVLAECYRVARSGGVIRLTEYGPTETNSLAVDQALKLIAQLLKKRGFGFSPDGSTFGLNMMLGGFLKKIGCKDIQYKLYGVDYSHGTPLHAIQIQNLIVDFTRLRPLLITAGLVTEVEWSRLDSAIQEELNNPEFRALQYWYTCWGEKMKGGK